MSVLEIILYSILGVILTIFMIYQFFFKKKREKKQEEQDDEE